MNRTETFKRTKTVRSMHFAHPAEEIFPLLCPVREYDWIEHWQCAMIFSQSGVAEAGCVFTTDFPGDGPATWVCTRYEPPLRIDYTTFSAAGYVRTLEIVLQPDETEKELAQNELIGCGIQWILRFTPLTPSGSRAVDALTPEKLQADLARLEKELAHYLAQGEMLRH
ncbi:MAG: hypothetical protein ACNI3A_08885 [Desulfovibrio sp.]|uniref:hypothetical protein n=1 Tax=Desulfovibrio sp. 7SRBS1 TaxID=3378064 RepID=UPI003B3E805D